ncbi:MAG: PilZ domain-containing protein [Deltaproteobacteria bacterium]|jgi:hypothetical protein|nr:PilZ domain-containing protein [Deltaproteobacteria bacterium]TSA13280.1 MAG: PilZ domain-containing protein [Deltaproteobacteria bacterium]
MNSEKERRKYERIPTFLPITYSDGKKFFKEYAHDVSLGGLLIKSIDPCDIGMPLDMAIDAHVPIKAKGKVAWVKKDDYLYRIGVQLKEMDVYTAADWANFLNRVPRSTAH